MSAFDAAGPCSLAGGTAGPAALRPLLGTVLDALAAGAAERGGPLPGGGPAAVAARVRATVGAVLPEHGAGAREALGALVGAVARGAADPSDPLCAAHLHCPPLAVAAAADLAASALNPSMDSWDQAPAASELEALVCRELAGLVYGGAAAAGGPGVPDAVVTTGGTEANQLAVLLARERARVPSRLRVVCGANAHHSVHRAAWLLGLEPPVVVPTPRGVLDPVALEAALARLNGRAGASRSARASPSPSSPSSSPSSPSSPSPGAPTVAAQAGPEVLVVATAGTTDTGDIDPLAEIGAVAALHRARWHVDAAYGGPLLFSAALRGRLAGAERADSFAFDLHKLGWQPVAAGVLAVPDGGALLPLGHRAEYLNADDDTEAGLPDLLGRSLRTTRRPDVLKVAVTLRALGRTGVAELVERTCAVAGAFAERVAASGRFELYGEPPLSTVLFRPVGAEDAVVALVRRRLLAEGRAVLGRASLRGRLWWKATFLNPWAEPDDLSALLGLVDACVDACVGAGAEPEGARS